MRKLLSGLLACALLLGALAGCQSGGASSSKSGGQLNLYTWEGMFPPEVLEGFESETGIKINYSNYDFGETMLTKLQTAGGGEYDLVIADDYIVESVIAADLAQKLDKSKLPNFGNINPVYQGQFFDPADEYTVPYGAGVQTIVYNPETVAKPITGYADLWDPDFKDKIGMIANYRVINGMALKVLGESYNTGDLDKIQAAGDKLTELAPNVRLIKDDNLQDDLISGEIDVAIMYTSQVTLAKLSKPELEMVFPVEGIGFGVMPAFIPSKAPNAEAAYRFLEYLLRPEIGAQCFEWLGYYSTNGAADEHIAEEFQDFLTLPADFGGDTEMIENIGADAQDLHAKIWTEFKTACGQ